MYYYDAFITRQFTTKVFRESLLKIKINQIKFI